MKHIPIIFFLFIISSCTTKKNPVTIKESEINGKTYLFVHGAWGGGWEYDKVDSILTKKGHEVHRPTLTGLGERVHLAHEEINLTTHVNDILNVVRFENLDNIILIGHSYGGMVIAGVAEQIPNKIKHLIYLDAFVPQNGESVKSINGEGVWNGMIAPRIKNGFIEFPFGEVTPTDIPQPLKTFTEILSLKNPLVNQIPTSFILMIEDGKANFEEWGSNRANKKGWTVYKMEGGHYAMREQPEKLVDQLESILNNSSK